MATIMIERPDGSTEVQFDKPVELMSEDKTVEKMLRDEFGPKAEFDWRDPYCVWVWIEEKVNDRG